MLLADKVRSAIEASAAVLVLMTQAALQSRYVQQEIGAANQAGRLVVALVDPALQSENLAMLEGVEVLWFDYENAIESVPALMATLNSLGRDVEPAPPAQVPQPGVQMTWQFAGSIQLTPGQAVAGFLIFGAIFGLIIYAISRGETPDGSESDAPGEA